MIITTVSNHPITIPSHMAPQKVIAFSDDGKWSVAAMYDMDGPIPDDWMADFRDMADLAFERAIKRDAG